MAESVGERREGQVPCLGGVCIAAAMIAYPAAPPTAMHALHSPARRLDSRARPPPAPPPSHLPEHVAGLRAPNEHHAARGAGHQGGRDLKDKHGIGVAPCVQGEGARDPHSRRGLVDARGQRQTPEVASNEDIGGAAGCLVVGDARGGDRDRGYRVPQVRVPNNGTWRGKTRHSRSR